MFQIFLTFFGCFYLNVDMGLMSHNNNNNKEEDEDEDEDLS